METPPSVCVYLSVSISTHVDSWMQLYLQRGSCRQLGLEKLPAWIALGSGSQSCLKATRESSRRRHWAFCSSLHKTRGFTHCPSVHTPRCIAAKDLFIHTNTVRYRYTQNVGRCFKRFFHMVAATWSSSGGWMWFAWASLELQDYSRLGDSESAAHGQGRPKLSEKYRNICVLGDCLPVTKKIPFSLWSSNKIREPLEGS